MTVPSILEEFEVALIVLHALLSGYGFRPAAVERMISRWEKLIEEERRKAA